MRRPATVARLALACASLGGCATGAELSPPPSPSSPPAAAAASRVALPTPGVPAASTPAAPATAPEPAYAATDHSSRGSPKFGDFVRAHQPQLQFCYAEARTAHRELSGSATVAVTLADDGSVTTASVVRRSWTGKGGDDVERCMLAKLRAWHFPSVGRDESHTHSFAVIFSS